MDKEEYLKSEKKQTIHRTLNTILSICVLVVSVLMINPVIKSTHDLYEQVSGIQTEKVIESEISQIADDEGYKPCYYKDSLGLGTIGFGTLVKDSMRQGDCIKGQKAVELLREHYIVAKTSVEKRYPWADGRKKLVLINLSYNMGETRLSKFDKMLYHLERNDFDKSAGELLDSRYAKQVPYRAGRMAGRIMGLGG